MSRAVAWLRRPSVLVRLVLAVGFVALGAWPAAPAGAADDSMDVDSIAEAWYQKPEVTEGVAEAPELPDTSDPCALLPIGCPAPLPVPPPEAPAPGAAAYPVGTLHVEAVAGKSTARAYVVPDLTLLPYDATLLGGELTLPVNRTETAGSHGVDTARFIACLTTEPVADGDTGRPSGAPAYDCDAATAKVRFQDGENAFAVDLGAFIEKWKAGAPNYGVALLPAKDLGPEATWHVTLNGSDVEQGKGASSTIRYSVPEVETPVVPEEPIGVPEAPVTSGGGVLTPEPPAAAPPPAADEVPTAAPAAPVAPMETAPFSLLNKPWYTYRGVVFLPLAFLVALSFTGRSLTRPLVRLGGLSRGALVR
jgi:hypothetical protein